MSSAVGRWFSPVTSTNSTGMSVDGQTPLTSPPMSIVTNQYIPFKNTKKNSLYGFIYLLFLDKYNTDNTANSGTCK